MKKTLIALLAIAAGIGIGYWLWSKPTQPESRTVPTATVPKPVAPSPKPASVAPTPTSTPAAPTAAPATATPTEPSAVTPPVVDATWKTYTNAALGFAFDWPTKGRYAPTWEVTFVKEDDASIVNGCHTESYNPVSTVNVSLNGFVFCHTSYSDGAAGTIHLIDDYATKIGHQYVVIGFLKAFNNLATPPFDGTAYGAHLDQIVSTFRSLP